MHSCFTPFIRSNTKETISPSVFAHENHFSPRLGSLPLAHTLARDLRFACNGDARRCSGSAHLSLETFACKDFLHPKAEAGHSSRFLLLSPCSHHSLSLTLSLACLSLPACESVQMEKSILPDFTGPSSLRVFLGRPTDARQAMTRGSTRS